MESLFWTSRYLLALISLELLVFYSLDRTIAWKLRCFIGSALFTDTLCICYSWYMLFILFSNFYIPFLHVVDRRNLSMLFHSRQCNCNRWAWSYIVLELLRTLFCTFRFYRKTWNVWCNRVASYSFLGGDWFGPLITERIHTFSLIWLLKSSGQMFKGSCSLKLHGFNCRYIDLWQVVSTLYHSLDSDPYKVSHGLLIHR